MPHDTTGGHAAVANRGGARYTGGPLVWPPFPMSPTPQSQALRVAQWFLRLAVHPVAGRWMMADADRFAAFYACLCSRLPSLDQTMRALARAPEGEVRIDDLAFLAWKKETGLPMRGRAGYGYLRSFWMGLSIHKVLSQEAMAAEQTREIWTGLLKLQAAHGDGEGGAGTMDDPEQMPHLMFALNLRMLTAFWTLSPAELLVMELSFLMAQDTEVRLFFDLMTEDAPQAGDFMAIALGMSEQAWAEATKPDGDLALSRLMSFHPNTRRVFPMAPFWRDWLAAPATTPEAFLGHFILPLKPTRNAGAMGQMAPEDSAIVREILRRSAEETGVNVLLYGPKTIDTMGLVHHHIQALGRKAFTLGKDIPPEDQGTACYLAQRYVHTHHTDGILVLPKADHILTRTQRGNRQFLFFSINMDEDSLDSEWERRLLLDTPTPCVWLVYRPDNLSEENIGRFLYACPVKAASRAERRVSIGGLLKDLDLPESFHTELAQHTQLGEEQIKSACRLAKWLSRPDAQGNGLTLPHAETPQALRESLVRRAIDQSQKTLDRRVREELRKSVTRYSLDLLNTSGGFTVPQIIKALKGGLTASVCLWGLPGTGKTQLAETLAVELDKPLLVKRASDLMGKFVGESEKAICKMFEDAADAEAVLFLDEADTFLRDRSLAHHQWEVGMVNELLQGMERFRGVFICATNLFNNIDIAAMRRFTFKIQFHALTEDQRWTMFVNEAGIDPETLNATVLENWRTELALMVNLTPGDFTTVQRQCHLLGTQLTPEEWLRSLAFEVKAKNRTLEAEEKVLTGGRQVHRLP